MRDYRRGVLLGLSLAEVFILLLFCFLLLIAPRFASNTVEQQPKGDAPPVMKPDVPATNSSPTNKLPPVDGPDIVPGTPVPTPNPPETTISPGPKPPVTPTPSPQSLPQGASEAELQWWKQKGQSLRIGFPSNEPTFPWQSNSHKPAPKKPEASGKQDGKHDWPPIIPLREAEGYKFDTGSAEVSPEFDERLRTVVKDAIIATIQKYPAADVIEVVGHTDERPINGASNLDASLIAVLSGDASAEQLLSADNVGLGMARAAAVAVVLRSCPELTQFKIIPYSGGQIIEPGDRLATGENSGDRGERRRIEIKIRGSNSSSN